MLDATRIAPELFLLTVPLYIIVDPWNMYIVPGTVLGVWMDYVEVYRSLILILPLAKHIALNESFTLFAYDHGTMHCEN